MRAAVVFSVVLLFPFLVSPAFGEPRETAVVLVLVDRGLTWESAGGEAGLERVFRDGAVASLSTAQGKRPEDPRIGYVLIGAGSRADTAILPEELPQDREDVPAAFRGPAATIRPGSLGDALARDGVRAAAVGERAALAVMDSKGRVPIPLFGAGEPAARVQESLRRGAGFVAVEVAGPAEAAEVSSSALRAGATVAVAAPNAAPGSANLTPFAVSGPDGVLYSPGTRTAGLVLNSDVAPTLLSRLGVRSPPEMEGRPAVTRPGTTARAENLYERLAFVAQRFRVWSLAGIVMGASIVALGALGRREGLRTGVLLLTTLPAAALLAALVPVTSAPSAAALIALLAGGITLAARRIAGSGTGALAAVCLFTAALIVLDAALGGPFMRFSTLGYNPGYGARFYGTGNEYAAVLAGAFPVGLGAILPGRSRRVAVMLLAAGAVVVLVLALPTMGADVGGSLALGFGVGFTAGLLGSGDARKTLRRATLWAAGGLAFAAALFLASGLLFPGVSHGSRALGEGAALISIIWRKLLLSFGHLLNPAWSILLLAGALVTYAGWRRVAGTPLGAGIAGGAVSAAASGALNDSGILATLFALAYPAAAALILLLSTAR